MVPAVAILVAVASASTPPVVLDNKAARVSFDAGGGGLVDFHLKDSRLNPFTWDSGTGSGARPRGHFLCLDRWGAPTDAEKANGMPFHGEAAQVAWTVDKTSATAATMSATLPLAALTITRQARLHAAAPVVMIAETVTNQAKLGRIYNMVQHPTLGPPFLDATTVIDANAGKGFSQASPLPDPERQSFDWPQALKDGQPVDMRRLTDDPLPNVVSYVVDADLGWTTAATPARGLLVGYIWRVADYPWLNLWRDVRGGKPHARGLEFGTTGLHQPPPVLVAKGRIFDRPLFAFLDASASITRRYAVFLMKIPGDFGGVARVVHENGKLTVHERGSSRTFAITTGNLFPE